MPYVTRNKDGRIITLVSEASGDAAEKLSANDPEVLAFLQESETDTLTHRYLTTSDIELVRALEDLINLLIDKNLINFIELPDAVQKKLLNRKHAREKLRAHETLLIDDDDNIL